MELELIIANIFDYTKLIDRYNVEFSKQLIKNLEALGNDIKRTMLISEIEEKPDKAGSRMKKISEIDPIFSDFDDGDRQVLCDDFIIVKNRKNDKFLLIDIQDGNTLLEHVIKHDKCVGVIETFYDQHYFDNNIEKSHLITPGHYFTMQPLTIAEHYEEISKIEPTDKRLFFSGTIGHENNYTKADGKARREIATVLKEKHPDEVRLLGREQKLPRHEWWREAAKHYINLALPGHPWCNREHELWALGLPVLASEWVNPTIHCPRPNYHYLAADGGKNREYTGTCLDVEYAADKLYERYKKSINEPEYLKWIGNNGRKYYLNYIKPSSSAKYYAETINDWVYLK